MSAELTATDIDDRLTGLGVGYRWRADVDGYSVIYTTYNEAPPNTLADRLLRLRAVIDAIDAGGTANGVPLRSFQVPLLAGEYDRLQRDVQNRIKGSIGGVAGKGRTRSATVAVLRKAFAELGYGEETETYLAWLEDDNLSCEYHDGRYVLNYNGLKGTTLNRRQVMKAISRERKNA